MGPCNAQLSNVNYVICACVGAVIAINGLFGFSMTPGALISFLTYNKQFSQPINQITMQMNSIVMALAGADRIFKLLNEKPEVDDGYVTLVRCKKEKGEIVECSERTGMWAWKHYHKDTDTTTYKEMKGEIVFDGVDTMMTKLYFTMLNYTLIRDKKLPLSDQQVPARQQLLTL
jgi:ATP-binding cassette subfamily B protein